MLPLIRTTLIKGKLTYLWITRILLAPNHFDVPLVKRVYFAVSGGFTCDQVGRYDLTPQSKRNFISEFDWYRSRSINAPFDSMLNNKIACNEVLRHHIQVPAIEFVKNKGRLVALTDTHVAVRSRDVLTSLQESEAYFLKPFAAGKGKGIHRMDFLQGEYLLDGKVVEPEILTDLMEKSDGWFLSQAVKQHSDLADIYPETTNTLRLITVRNDQGESEVLFVVLRLGTAATVPVDNGSRGGLVAKVDLETGVLSHATSLWSQAEYSHHPNSGAPIEGVKLPGWSELLPAMLALADSLPYLQFVAWDVLLTETGPVVIEANTSSGVNIIQVWGPQRQQELGDFYRMHGVIK